MAPQPQQADEVGRQCVLDWPITPLAIRVAQMNGALIWLTDWCTTLIRGLYEGQGLSIHNVAMIGLKAIIAACLVYLLFASLGMCWRWARSVLFPYPMTQWGFRGKLLYVDDGTNTKVFRNHRYGVSCNPDALYRLNNSKIAYIEGKSRKQVKESDITQLEVGIVALRGTYNVTQGAITLSDGTLHWIDSAEYSTGRLYRRNKTYVEQARKLKLGRLRVEAVWKDDQCPGCPMQVNCWGDKKRH